MRSLRRKPGCRLAARFGRRGKEAEQTATLPEVTLATTKAR